METHLPIRDSVYLVGLLYRMPQLRASREAIYSSVSAKSKTDKFWVRRSTFSDLGMAVVPLCTAQRKRICVAVLEWAAAMSLTTCYSTMGIMSPSRSS